MKNIVYIATSIDGFIADKDGDIGWLNIVPNPNNEDTGWSDFISKIDCVVMGRKTFEKVLSFNVPWPYPVKVFVLSRSMKKIPLGYEAKIEIMSGNPKEITSHLKNKGFCNAYIDGGVTIQEYLKVNLIDEMTITKIPIILGSGIPLFNQIDSRTVWEHLETKILLKHMVMTKYKRSCL